MSNGFGILPGLSSARDILPGLTGGEAKASGVLVERETLVAPNIQIAPTAVNLGEMLKVFEGPPENGGLGVSRPSLFDRGQLGLAQASLNVGPMVLLVAAGAAVLILARKR